MLFAILLAPRLILFLAKAYLIAWTSLSAYWSTLSYAYLKISSKAFFLGAVACTVNTSPVNVWRPFDVRPSSFVMCWLKCPERMACLMLLATLLWLTALKAVKGLQPWLLTDEGSTLSKSIMFYLLASFGWRVSKGMPIFLVPILAD